MTRHRLIREKIQKKNKNKTKTLTLLLGASPLPQVRPNVRLGHNPRCSLLHRFPLMSYTHAYTTESSLQPYAWHNIETLGTKSYVYVFMYFINIVYNCSFKRLTSVNPKITIVNIPCKNLANRTALLHLE